jgi:acetolactate synthase small subunit
MSGPSDVVTLSLRLLDDGSAVERVANAMRRRGHVIRSMEYGFVGEPGVSRMTVTVSASRCRPERLGDELRKLYCVLEVSTEGNGEGLKSDGAPS